MAKIRDARPKQSSGGYDRVFDDKNIGALIQKVQSVCISNGNELESIVIERAMLIPNSDLDAFISDCNQGIVVSGNYLCTKKMVKHSRYKVREGTQHHEPDLIIFEINHQCRGKCYIIELKDGDAFDTKKADGELASLRSFCNSFGVAVPFVTDFYICCFNQSDKDAIVKGFKNRFSVEHVMTGRELCDLLHIDYDRIITDRKIDAADNVSFFVESLVEIPKIQDALSDKRKSCLDEASFYSDD